MFNTNIHHLKIKAIYILLGFVLYLWLILLSRLLCCFLYHQTRKYPREKRVKMVIKKCLTCDCAILTCAVCLFAQPCPTLHLHGLQPASLLYPRGFSREEYWSELSCPSPGDLPNPGQNPGLPHSRWVLYCLSHQGSAILTLKAFICLPLYSQAFKIYGANKFCFLLHKNLYVDTNWRT